MFNNFKKLAFVAGTAFVFANADATTVTIAGEIQVDAGGTLEVTRLVPLSDEARVQNYGVIMGHTEAGAPGEKIQHPTGVSEEAYINNYGGVTDGDGTKIASGVYSGGGFTGIRAKNYPFLDANLIASTAKTEGGWGNGSGEIVIGDTADVDGINLVTITLAADYNNSGAPRTGCVYDFQDVGNTEPAGRVNLLADKLGSPTVVEIDTSDTSHQPAYVEGTAPCGIAAGTFHWPIPSGSIGALSISMQAKGSGTVRLEGNNAYFQNGTAEVSGGTTLLVTAATSMPQSDITVGVAADTSNCTFTFPSDLAAATTYSVAAGKTLSLVHGASGNGQAVVKNLSTLDVSAGTLDVQTGTKVTVEHGGTLIL